MEPTKQNALLWLKNYLGDTKNQDVFIERVVHSILPTFGMLKKVVAIANPTDQELMTLCTNAPLPLDWEDREWEARWLQDLAYQAYQAIETAPDIMKPLWQRLACSHYANARAKMGIY